MKPWNNWFHCNGNTYGTWVRGDPRGWRSRDHHEHVEGDYKRPPPKDAWRREFEQSLESMPRDAVELPYDARRPACEAMVNALLFHAVEVLSFSVGRVHRHGLLRFDSLDGRELPPQATRNRTVRHIIGIAKKRGARALSDLGLVEKGGVWGGRGGVKPINDRKHQKNVYPYILDHLDEGAVVYDYRRGFIEPRIEPYTSNNVSEIPET